jgi:hypothetical protein
LLRKLRLGKPGHPLGAQQAKAAARNPKGEAGLLKFSDPHSHFARSSSTFRLSYFDSAQPDELRLHPWKRRFRAFLHQHCRLRARLAKHNAGEVPHTSKYRPWRLKTYVAFSDEQKAFDFEKDLKSASGRAFAKKRL